MSRWIASLGSVCPIDGSFDGSGDGGIGQSFVGSRGGPPPHGPGAGSKGPRVGGGPGSSPQRGGGVAPGRAAPSRIPGVNTGPGG